MTTPGYHFPSHNLFGQRVRDCADTKSVAHLRQGASHVGGQRAHAHVSSSPNTPGGCYAPAPGAYTSAVQRSSPRVAPAERKVPIQNCSPTQIPATRAPPASYTCQTVSHNEVSRAQSSAAAAREAAAYASNLTRMATPASPLPAESLCSKGFYAPRYHGSPVNTREVNRQEVNAAYQVKEQRVNMCESSARYPRASIGAGYPAGMPQHIHHPEPRNNRPDVDLSPLLPGIIPPNQGVAVPEINDVYHRTSVYAASGVPMDMPAFSGDRAWTQRLAH